MIQSVPDARPDIGQVLRVAQQACESIARSGTVSDAIPVGNAQCGPGNVNQRPPSRHSGAAGTAAQQQQQQPQQAAAAAAAAAPSGMSDD